MKARIEPVVDVDAFIRTWRRLYSQADEPPFYLSPAWVIAWIKGRPRGSKVFQLIIEEAGEPILMTAFGQSNNRYSTLFGSNPAHCMEYGLPAHDAIYIEFNDFLTHRQHHGGQLKRIAARALLTNQTVADRLVFRNARQSFCNSIIAIAEENGRHHEVINSLPTFQSNLLHARDSGKTLLDGLRASVRSAIKRSIRLYRQRGELRLVIEDGSQDYRQSFDLIKDLHAKTWATRGSAGVYSNPLFLSFHNRLFAEAPEVLSLCTVFAGDQLIGGLHNFVHNDRVLSYQSGFQYEPDNRLKPGLISHALAAQHYMDAGYAVYDFLAGEARYKRELGMEGETLSTVVIERNGARARIRNKIKQVRAVLPGYAKTHQT